MGKVYTETDMAAAWESGYWHGTSHEGPLNDDAVSSRNPHKETARIGGRTVSGCGCEWLGDCSCEVREVPVTTPAKACRVALKTEKGRGAPVIESATASEPTND